MKLKYLHLINDYIFSIQHQTFKKEFQKKKEKMNTGPIDNTISETIYLIVDEIIQKERKRDRDREREKKEREREKWSGFWNIMWDRRSVTRPTHSCLICFKFTMVMWPIEAVEEGHRSRRSAGCVWSLDDAISQPLDKRAAGRRSIKAARTNNFWFFIRHYLLPCIQKSSVIYGCWWCGNPGWGGSHL